MLNRTGIITIVDLCGSERIKNSQVTGARAKEAININSSLTALKSVIQAICSRAKHVPFRDSILTWVLKDCIGGNSKVAILAHIRPCAAHAYESISTLRFVSMVKTVKTRVTKNERFKSEEELAEMAALEAEEEARQRAIGRPEVHVVAPLPAQTADSGTQVSPSRNSTSSSTRTNNVEGVLLHLKSDILELKALFDQGVLDEGEYQLKKRRIFDLWMPAKPEDCADEIPHLLLLRTLELCLITGASDNTCDSVAACTGDAENIDPNLSQRVAPRDRAVPMTIKGPGADSENDIMVRICAPLSTVAKTLEACLPDPGTLNLYYLGQPLDPRASVASLNLPDHCVLEARLGPSTPFATSPGSVCIAGR